MDDIQIKIVEMHKSQPGCKDNRQQLKAILSDVIPEEKLFQNILLIAYDEDVVTKLSNGQSDTTMQALMLVKNINENYGLEQQLALWSVTTWCYMLGYNEVSNILETMFSNNNNSSKESATNKAGTQYRPEYDFQGVYRAGKDFPCGNIQIVLNGALKEEDCDVYVSKKPNIDRNKPYVGRIKDQAYVSIQDGEYLQVYVWYSNPKFGYKIIGLD